MHLHITTIPPKASFAKSSVVPGVAQASESFRIDQSIEHCPGENGVDQYLTPFVEII